MGNIFDPVPPKKFVPGAGLAKRLADAKKKPTAEPVSSFEDSKMKNRDAEAMKKAQEAIEKKQKQQGIGLSTVPMSRFFARCSGCKTYHASGPVVPTDDYSWNCASCSLFNWFDKDEPVAKDEPRPSAFHVGGLAAAVEKARKVSKAAELASAYGEDAEPFNPDMYVEFVAAMAERTEQMYANTGMFFAQRRHENNFLATKPNCGAIGCGTRTEGELTLCDTCHEVYMGYPE